MTIKNNNNKEFISNVKNPEINKKKTGEPVGKKGREEYKKNIQMPNK